MANCGASTEAGRKAASPPAVKNAAPADVVRIKSLLCMVIWFSRLYFENEIYLIVPQIYSLFVNFQTYFYFPSNCLITKGAIINTKRQHKGGQTNDKSFHHDVNFRKDKETSSFKEISCRFI
jgi:hypothetical protein